MVHPDYIMHAYVVHYNSPVMSQDSGGEVDGEPDGEIGEMM